MNVIIEMQYFRKTDNFRWILKIRLRHSLVLRYWNVAKVNWGEMWILWFSFFSQNVEKSVFHFFSLFLFDLLSAKKRNRINQLLKDKKGGGRKKKKKFEECFLRKWQTFHCSGLSSTFKNFNVLKQDHLATNHRNNF